MNVTTTTSDPTRPFPECHADEVRQIFRERGAEGVVAFALDRADRVQRRQLFALAHQEIGCADGHGGNLDGYVTLMHCAFDEFLRQAAEETDPAEAAKRKDYANILAFNFSSTLAECWPEDGTPRAERHFREGLLAAERCLAWRRELGKGPGPFSLAWWAKGAHELSLGRAADAAISFATSGSKAAEVARAGGASTAIEVGGDFGVILAEGYCGLALARAGDPAGAARFEAACAAFEGTAAQAAGEAGDDARFGAAQLRCMRDRLDARA